ncbi:YceI family protein [Streptosporangium jomthongense]|uniref:YceI family protein n=1 Tax=Streptosporangium jomthongense TaxID=1193683 RepID=A0ABV8FGI1_9ACTN
MRSSGTDYVIGGDLTMKATTLSVELRLTYGGVIDDPLGRRAGFLGRARFSRAAFGVAETMGLRGAGVPARPLVPLDQVALGRTCKTWR